jgi:hypothetical protein
MSKKNDETHVTNTNKYTSDDNNITITYNKYLKYYYSG